MQNEAEIVGHEQVEFSFRKKTKKDDRNKLQTNFFIYKFIIIILKIHANK